jgi:hypothetical protein
VPLGVAQQGHSPTATLPAGLEGRATKYISIPRVLTSYLLVSVTYLGTIMELLVLLSFMPPSTSIPHWQVYNTVLVVEVLLLLA